MNGKLLACLLPSLTLVSCAKSVTITPEPPQSAAAPLNDAPYVVLHIDAVRVADFAPSGTKWDGQAADDSGFGCAVVSLATLALSPVYAAATEQLCMTLAAPEEQERDASAPDLYVRVRTSGSAVYDSHTVNDSHYASIAQQFLIPTAAVAEPGLEVLVFDKDGPDQEADTLLGRFVIPRQTLSKPGLSLDLTDGSVAQLNLHIVPFETAAHATSIMMSVSEGLHSIPQMTVPAGMIVEADASGSYRVGSWFDRELSPAGYAGTGPRQYNLTIEPFASAPHGCGVLVVRQHQSIQGAPVTSCHAMITRHGGVVEVGVNDREPANNTGSISFSTRVSLPTPAQWLYPETVGDCGVGRGGDVALR